jgi:hypothetical protein
MRTVRSDRRRDPAGDEDGCHRRGGGDDLSRSRRGRRGEKAIATEATIQPVEMQHAAILNFVLGAYPVPTVESVALLCAISVM